MGAILQQAKTSVERLKPRVELEVDQQVRVNESPLANSNGTVDEVNYECDRLRVSVQIFSHEAPIELEFGQAEEI